MRPALPALALLLGCGRSPAPTPPPAPASEAIAPAASAPPATPEVPDAPAFAFVELFTSEGCSSCPPADVVASSLVTRKDVVVLAWHVDDWDHLGWRDPWSRKAASDRQRALAVAFGSGLYTPQIVVDGRTEMVGSHATAVEDAVSSALTTPRRAALTGQRLPGSKGAIEVEVTARGAPSGSVLHATLVEDGLVGRPTKGENAGRVLRHDAVVRATLETSPTGEAQRLTLTPPPDAHRERLGVVVWLARSDGVVVAARRL